MPLLPLPFILIFIPIWEKKEFVMSKSLPSHLAKFSMVTALLCLCSWAESPGQTSSPPLQIKDRKKQSSAEQKGLVEDINSLEEEVANLLNSLEKDTQEIKNPLLLKNPKNRSPPQRIKMTNCNSSQRLLVPLRKRPREKNLEKSHLQPEAVLTKMG